MQRNSKRISGNFKGYFKVTSKNSKELSEAIPRKSRGIFQENLGVNSQVNSQEVFRDFQGNIKENSKSISEKIQKKSQKNFSGNSKEKFQRITEGKSKRFSGKILGNSGKTF